MISNELLHIPFLEKIGATLDWIDDHIEVSLTVTPDLLNNWGSLQGGAVMTLLDVAMGAAARVQMTESDISLATVDMQTHFLSPAGETNDKVVATGKVFHQTHKMFFCEAELRNDGRLVAKSTGIFKKIQSHKMREGK